MKNWLKLHFISPSWINIILLRKAFILNEEQLKKLGDCSYQTVLISKALCYLNVDHENHFLMNAPEVSEQQLSKHDRQDGDRAIECTTEINDSRARIEEDRADLFTPYWMYLQNSACHRSLSIIATPIPLCHRTKFPQARVRCEQNRQLFLGSVFQSPSSLSHSLVELLSMWSSGQVSQRFFVNRTKPHDFIQCFFLSFSSFRDTQVISSIALSRVWIL